MKNRELKKQRYQKRMAYFKEHPRAAQTIHILNRLFTYLVFAAYPLLLVYLLYQRNPLLARAIIVPMNGFVLLSVIRYFINRKRPYEAYDTEPAIKKSTKGNSFPSRHVFSVFVIAMTFLACAPDIWYGIALLVLGIGIAAVRVISGVHYISDVLAAAGIAVLAGVIGFWVIPV